MDLSRFSSVIDFGHLPHPEETWDLREKIGEGTFGEVYRAVHKQTGEEIAVKVLDSLHEVIEEVEEEYKILRDLGTHPNLPAFHGLFLTAPQPALKPQLWIAMELCRGGSVTDLVRAELQRGSHLPELLLAHILKEVLQALYHLHSNHVVHRDVKGHNILLTSDAKVKLIDFGVSGHLDSSLSRRHTSVGTPFWMAPEVIACEQQLDYTYDVRCDVWSLGVTAIEIADGEPPFADLHPMRALFKIPRSPPPTLKQPSKWSERFRDFVSCCVVKDFEKRVFVKQLLTHPFITQVSEQTLQVEQQLAQVVHDSGHMIQEPYITSKKEQQAGGEESTETGKVMEDLARLETLDEDSIVSCLEERYHGNQIYTYMGDILLAVNPFTAIPIYTQQWSSRYIDAVKGDHPPHIYAVADHAYQEMMHHQHNQCVVISGESGAGKTESANFLVQQLTMLGKAPNRNLEERILLVNPLVEAFGNAATVINENSSRFGKYLEMSFTPSGKVTGASMTEYLLEKSRVVQQASGEQNFHVFSYIYHGLSQEDRTGRYHLQDQTVYRYLTNVDSDPKTVAAHRLKYKTVQKCFEIIGFKSQEVSSVYSILAAILHLGNVDFTEAESHHDTRTKVKDKQLQHLVAELLGIDTKELSDSLTSSGMVARGETIVKHYTVVEATSVRDAMAKALYGRLFSWIVNKINLLLKPGRQQGYGEERNMVGILDIFGFENFAHNSFEQLCINIANEQIQSYFNQHIFLWEQKEYVAEGIDPVRVTFTDNQPVLELLLAKPLGLLALLDEESNFPKATDQSLVDKFAANLPGNHFHLIRSHDLGFSVQHYAGTVVYDSGGFLEKNRDRLALEVTSVLRTSQVALVRTLFNANISRTGALRGNQSGGGGASGSLPKESATLPSWSIRSASNSSTLSQSRLQQTVASYFRFSLTDLLSKLVTGTPHFVRCIRPNTENSPSFFDRQKVMVQLRYTGVLETTRIRREGFPHRIHYNDFVNRYAMMINSDEKKMSGTQENCVIILQKLGLKDYALGNTKVFLKYYEQERLCRLYVDYQRRVVCVQAWFRMWLQRRRYHRQLIARQGAAVNMQRAVRGWLCRKQYVNEQATRQRAAITIQTGLRGYMVRCAYQPLIEARRAATLTLQAVTRGHLQRRRYHDMKRARERCATNIQAAVRGYLCRRELSDQKERVEKEKSHLNWAATMLQKNFRMWKAQAEVTKRQLQTRAEEGDREVFNQQVDKSSIKMFHTQVLSMERSSSTESEDWSEERKELMQRVTERKQVWGAADRDYYYGMQSVNAGKSLWTRQRDRNTDQRPNGTKEPNEHSNVERSNGLHQKIIYGPKPNTRPSPSDVRLRNLQSHNLSKSQESLLEESPFKQKKLHQACPPQNTCDNCRSRQQGEPIYDKYRQKSCRKVSSDNTDSSNTRQTRTDMSARLGGHCNPSTEDKELSKKETLLPKGVGQGHRLDPEPVKKLSPVPKGLYHGKTVNRELEIQKKVMSTPKGARHGQTKAGPIDILPMFTRENSRLNSHNSLVQETSPVQSKTNRDLMYQRKGVSMPQNGTRTGHHHHSETPAAVKSRQLQNNNYTASNVQLSNQGPSMSNNPCAKPSEHQKPHLTSPKLYASSIENPSKMMNVKHSHKSHPSSGSKLTAHPNAVSPSVNAQLNSQRISHNPPLYASPLTMPRKNLLEASGTSRSPVMKTNNAPSRSDSRVSHKVHKQDNLLLQHKIETSSVLKSDNPVNVRANRDTDTKPPVPVKPKHLHTASNSSGLVQQPKLPPPTYKDRQDTVTTNGKKASQLQQNSSVQPGYKPDEEDSSVDEKNRQEIQEIDDMFNSVIELYTSKSENSRCLEEDGPSQREELQRETRDLQEQLVQSLEVQKKSSLSSRYIQEEKRAHRMEVRGSQNSEDKEVPLKKVNVPMVSGHRDTGGPVQVDFRSVLKKRGAKEEVQRLRTHILVS